tara:strand:- start:12184 stop:12615 length:432 start_codon:yes stop_codon:yes gene_type:complete
MAVSFTNNWKNIIDKLQNILRNEFKGALPVYRGDKAPAGTTYLQLNPVGSELLDYSVTSETREFTIQILYYFLEANVRESAMDHILRTVSRIEALIHDNVSMTLSDNTNAFNCRMQSTELDAGDEDMYVVEWEYKCMHLGNTG